MPLVKAWFTDNNLKLVFLTYNSLTRVCTNVLTVVPLRSQVYVDYLYIFDLRWSEINQLS